MKRFVKLKVKRDSRRGIRAYGSETENKRLFSVIILALSLALQACSFSDFTNDNILNNNIQNENGGDISSQTEGSEESNTAGDTDTNKIESSSLRDIIMNSGSGNEEADEDELLEVDDLCYLYRLLDDSEKRLYREIYTILAEYKKNEILSVTDKTLIDKIFNCVMNDHPELFYVSGYKYTEYLWNGKLSRIGLEGSYCIDEDEYSAVSRQIDQRVDEWLKNVPANEDEYSTVKYLYEYLIDSTEYDKNAENNQNICSVFLGGRSVCQGYAKAFQYLLNKMGIQALLVTGFTNGDRHAWNLVRVNGKYYYIDPTWGDASYMSGVENGGVNVYPSVNYDYFMVTTEEISRTHSFEILMPLEECTAKDDNYFVREGLYFDEYNPAQLAMIFDSEASRTKDYVTVKCASDSVFELMRNALIEEQGIFEYISNAAESIAYTENRTQRTLSFWNIFY